MYREILGKLLILKSIGTNAPVLAEWGLKFEKLLVVVGEKGQANRMRTLLAEDDIPVLNEFMSLRKVEKIFGEASSTFVPFVYSPSRKGQDFLNLLLVLSRAGEASGSKINAMPLVVSEEIPVGIDLSRCFTVFLEGDLAEIYLEEEDVVPPDEELSVVRDRIQTFLPRADTPDKRALLAATCFLYPNLGLAEREECFQTLLEEALRMAMLNEENQETGQLNQLFVEALYGWRERTGFHDIYELPYLEMQTVNGLDHVMLYDAEYVYMRESLFKQVVEPLLSIFSLGAIKQTLVNSRVLCTERATTYTVKMGYYNVAGQYQRSCMLRFSLDKLNRPGELGFLELCCEGQEV